MRSLVDAANRELETIIKRHAEELKQVTHTVELAEQLEPIIQQYNDTFLTYFYTSRWSITLYVSVDGFLSNVSPELMDLIADVETVVGVEATSYDLPDQNCRTYKCGKVEIYAEPRESGACNRVVVGTKKEHRSADVEVDVPTYAFVC